ERALSEFGVAAADFALADEILLGAYRARAEVAGATAGEVAVEVARYALPRLKLSLEADRAWYGPGERAPLTVEGRYFFGKPVAGGKLSVHARLEHGGVRAPLGTLSGTLDGDGKGHLELALPPGVEAGTLRLDAELTDAAQQSTSASRELPVSPS